MVEHGGKALELVQELQKSEQCWKLLGMHWLKEAQVEEEVQTQVQEQLQEHDQD